MAVTTVQAPKKYKFTKDFYNDMVAIIIPAPSSSENLDNNYYDSVNNGLLQIVTPKTTIGTDGVERLPGFTSKGYSRFTNSPTETTKIDVSPKFNEKTDDRIYVRIGNKSVATTWSGLYNKDAPVTESELKIINTSNVDNASTEYLLDKDYKITEAATVSGDEYKYYNSNGVKVNAIQEFTLSDGIGQIIEVNNTKIIYVVPNKNELNVYNASGSGADLLFQVKYDSDTGKNVYYDTFHLSERGDVLALFNKYLKFTYNTENWSVTLYHDDDFNVYGTAYSVDKEGHVLTFYNPYSSNTKIRKGGVSVSIDNTAPADCIISFNSNGGNKIATVIKGSGNDITLPTPEKTGYNFKGWIESDDDLNTKHTGSYHVTKTVILNADWTAVDYTITYKDGTKEIQPKNGVPTSYNVENPAALKRWHIPDGYTVEGWTFNDKLITSTEGLVGDITVYLKKNIITCLATFDTTCINQLVDGGTEQIEGSANPIPFDVTNPINTLPIISTVSGHFEFDGWTLNGKKVTSIEYQDVKDSISDKKIKLVATWVPHKYEVKYEYKDGNGEDANTTTYCDYGQTTSSIPDPVKYEDDKYTYTFSHWSKTEDNSAFDFERTSIVEDVTLHAVYTKTDITKTVTIKYRLQNANGTYSSSRTITANVSVGTEYDVTNKIKDVLGDNDKYYNVPEGQTILVSKTDNNSTDVLDIPRKTYNLSVDYNGDNDNNSNVDVNIMWDASITDYLKDVTKTYYTFNGYEIVGSSNKITSEQFSNYKMPKKDLSLKAQWTATDYPIEFTYTGASSVFNSPANISFNANSGTIPLPNSNPFNDDSYFDGWYYDNAYEQPTGDTVGASDLLGHISNGKVTLYAKKVTQTSPTD